MKASFKLKALFITSFLFLSFDFSYSQIGLEVTKVYGVTIDAVSNIKAVVNSLDGHKFKPTTRIVFDEWIPATEYTQAVDRIHYVSFIMGEILDSYYMNQYSVPQYTNRTNEYLNVLGDKVDIWEIGNEINGEWLGNKDSVVAKMTQAYTIVKGRNKKAALTLYYNFNCWENPQNEMFRWVLNNVPPNMKQGLDYVLVSYYEDDCNNYQPNWQRVFDSLHVIFPNSKLGIGECGTTNTNLKRDYINRYYRMKIATPNYIGGYFWWYYKQDCVPNTKVLWNCIDSAMRMCLLSGDEPDNISYLRNYPNPFNPRTVIRYNIASAGNVTIRVFDMLGREVSILVDEYKQPGAYEIEFEGTNLSSGIYYYALESNGQREVRKMVLVK
jgi:hypothetical protein